MKPLLKSTRRKRILLVELGLLFFLSLRVFGNTANSIFDQLHYKEVIEITIEADITALNTVRNTDEYQKGSLSFENLDGEHSQWNIKLRPRGKFRRNICEMTPLKLKFKKDDLLDKGLSPYNDLKLVTQCVENKQEAKQLLLKEYLAYRLYNELSDYSFRVQLVRINYKDTSTGKNFKQWGFLIEDKEQVEARMFAEACECRGADSSELHQNASKMVAMFQYMIGNEDYDFIAVRNLKMFRKNDKVIPVPYDFDFSGMVNAPYAVPNPDYGMKLVTERIYLGGQHSIEQLHSMQSFFHMKEAKLKEIVKDFKLLSLNERYVVMDYLDTFFQNLDAIRFKADVLAENARQPQPIND